MLPGAAQIQALEGVEVIAKLKAKKTLWKQKLQMSQALMGKKQVRDTGISNAKAKILPSCVPDSHYTHWEKAKHSHNKAWIFLGKKTPTWDSCK